jgi:hypothetical protein
MLKQLRYILLVSLLAFAGRSAAQAGSDTGRKSVDLNEFVVRRSGVLAADKKPRIRRTSLVIRPQGANAQTPWDSLLLLTRFPAPGTRKMVLHAISSRIAALDTSKLELFLVILQLRDHDTLRYKIPVTAQMLDTKTERFETDLRDSVITLAPVPFYLGFGFRVKPLSEEYRFPFYYTRGGEGAVLSFPQGRWAFISQPRSIYIFPFRMKYVESGD